jgi:hypothetical protein
VYVYLDKSHTPPQDAHDDLVDALRDQVATLKTELADWKAEAQRKDTIIMSLTQRIPELEAPSEPRESPETPTEGAEEDVPAPEQRGPWWRRWFQSR